MKITVMAGFFTERDVNIDTSHAAKISCLLVAAYKVDTVNGSQVGKFTYQPFNYSTYQLIFVQCAG
jgi:hypothetical protein